MSFEGYYQVLCENGHLNTWDVYSSPEENIRCHCGKKFVWKNLVDQTNGSFDNNNRIDGYVELEIETKAEECKCSKCGNTHKTGLDTYKIPKEK